MHHGGEAGAGPDGQAPVPDAAALLLPDGGTDPRGLPPATRGPRSPSQPSAWEEAKRGDLSAPHPPLPSGLGATGRFGAPPV